VKELNYEVDALEVVEVADDRSGFVLIKATFLF
jgi:hypothetical protein